MKNLIILILISLSIFAQDYKKIEKPKLAKEAKEECLEKNKENPYICDFQTELRKIWGNEARNIQMKENKLIIDMIFSKQQAQIDIAKAEMQKLFLRYIEEGKFKEDMTIKMPLMKMNLNNPKK